MYKSNTCRCNFAGWHYGIIAEDRYNTDFGDYRTYGIQVSGSDYLNRLYDVSTSRETVVRMAELFNLHQLSPYHFMDAVWDMMP